MFVLCKFQIGMSFDEVVSRHMYSNTKYVVCNGWNMGMLYIRDVYGVYGGY